MLTFHGNTTPFITQYTLNTMDENSKNCCTSSLQLCWWPAVNKAVSPCDLSIILVQLLLEHPVQVIQTTVDSKTKHFTSEIYTVHNM